MNSSRSIIALILLLSAYIAAQDNQPTDHWLLYEPALVEINGTLTVELRYGPPNYGENPETDERIQVPVLHLSVPVYIRGNPQSELNKESAIGIRQIQLIFGAGKSHKELIGKSVRVKGTLFRGHSGHHFTEIIMNVKEIYEVKPKGINGRE